MTTATAPKRSPRTKKAAEPRPLPTILAEILGEHRAAQDYLSARCRLHMQMLSLCRRQIYRDLKDAPSEAERKKLNDKAQDLLVQARAGDVPVLAIHMQAMFTAFDVLEAEEARRVKALAKLARELPIAPWVDSICGLGDVSVARIVAELRDPSAYSNPAKCWKRLGLAVIDGVRQSSVPDGLAGADKAAAWVARGYSPTRRSIVYVATESLLRKPNIYKDIYDQRKEYELPRVDTKMHAHRRAQRYVSKKLIKDLWRQWRLALGIPCPEPVFTSAP